MLYYHDARFGQEVLEAVPRVEAYEQASVEKEEKLPDQDNVKKLLYGGQAASQKPGHARPAAHVRAGSQVARAAEVGPGATGVRIRRAAVRARRARRNVHGEGAVVGRPFNEPAVPTLVLGKSGFAFEVEAVEIGRQQRLLLPGVGHGRVVEQHGHVAVQGPQGKQCAEEDGHEPQGQDLVDREKTAATAASHANHLPLQAQTPRA